MKVSKVFSAVVIVSAMLATVADAGSIGRSGGGSSGGGSRSSSSYSSSSSRSSSFSAPSKPSVAPAPSSPGGIGGNGSMGVRKSEVTGPVAQQVRPSTPSAPAGSYSGSQPTTSPNYGAPNYSAPAPVVVQSGGSGFGSSFAGALGGTLIGNALFGHHGSSGTTVVNNGGGGYAQGPAPVAQGGGYVDNGNGQMVQSGPVVVQRKEGVSMGSIIVNVILFAVLIAVIVGIVFLFYKGFKMIREYVNKERGVGPGQPFSPTARFWEIQRAFANADVTFLKTLLGPDLVDEATNNLQASTLTLSGVSHEVRLNNPREFSVWYTFEDAGDQVNQVWHYEKFGNEWLLNGIETV